MKRTVNIDVNTKGIVVFAKGKYHFADWILLVTKVEDIGSPNGLRIYGHIFYNIDEDRWCFSSGDENYAWGNIKYWDFYEPTKEQIKLIVDALKRRGYKYVPLLNKLIKKK